MQILTNHILKITASGILLFLLSETTPGMALGRELGTEAAISQEAALSCQQSEREFFFLKQYGSFQNYSENRSYVEVKDSSFAASFIGLQGASDESRTCLYGFFQPDTEHGTGLSVETTFLCFQTGAYNLEVRLEYNDEAKQPPDPAGISIGIGNIKIYNPEILHQGLDTEHLLDKYPKSVKIDLFQPGIDLPAEPIVPAPTRPRPILSFNPRPFVWPKSKDGTTLFDPSRPKPVN